ncbi:M43 family zinc metalloprotease [Flavobacterium sp. DG1-102-2]|uniref:M43 family zinc metalloprotease n=1 Tax=Flavobacterium sp. DG1-102-2 TaxID=3081663 RepID=UPI00294A7427|nr:M43 family zinc metalloprotease [Flavobacterium sp. DG1-102-2]MDV6167873.1 M43 family zinc metalloprotease [Flavobacterium sp. DG1-102-2]
MKSTTLKQAALGVALFLSGLTHAQDPKPFGREIKRNNEGFVPCAATEYLSSLQTGGKRISDAEFEQWLAPKVEAVRRQKSQKNSNQTVTLPVVVHVIHNGDELGTNENLSDERVLSQIQVLNEDFGRIQETPGYNEETPGVDTQIQFCLAQRDPDGNPTTGIEHIQMTRTSWNATAIETQLKPQTIWDPEKYINIWVCNFGGDLVGVGGYAFFPEASGLEGLDEAESTASGDGLTMYYKCFGSSAYAPEGEYISQIDMGRATTHEMGHFFGLRHIWGDGEDCSATDYCDDTPAALAMNTTCGYVDSCTLDDKPDMVENYMDYTPDACKSVFTENQNERMWATLNNALRRGTLITSDGCSAPTAGTNDNLLQGLNIYPNPVQDVLYIQSDITGVDGSYEIYTVTGQAIAAKNIRFEDGLNIDTWALSQGIYFVKLNRDGQTKTLKFIKQ